MTAEHVATLRNLVALADGINLEDEDFLLDYEDIRAIEAVVAFYDEMAAALQEKTA